MSEFTVHWDVWEKTIRDPAEQTKEGLRTLNCGPASAEYQTAQLPDDRINRAEVAKIIALLRETLE